jgi:hypothetical protein
MIAAVDQQHLALSALYLRLDLDAATPVSPEIRDSISQLKGRDTVLWLWVTSAARKPSDPAGDATAVPLMREVADLAQQAGLRVALYPHTGIWVERVEDAVRLARQVERKNFGVTFNLCHWLMVDGKNLDAYDTAVLLDKLQKIDYQGPVGLQHFGIQGDARANLQRSMDGWRRMQGVAMMPPGKALAAWQTADGWREVGNVKTDPQDPGRLVSEPGTGVVVSQGAGQYLLTKDRFGDCAVHVEFLIPRRSNSGVYLLGSHEVQIYDSHGVAKDEYPGIECGGIYPEWINDANVRGHAPLVNASKPAGEWQSFDVIYRAPRFDTAGNRIRNARFDKVFHNGKLVHENVGLAGPTRAGLPEQRSGPLRLQGDHGPVAFRNLRIRKLP